MRKNFYMGEMPPSEFGPPKLEVLELSPVCDIISSSLSINESVEQNWKYICMLSKLK